MCRKRERSSAAQVFEDVRMSLRVFLQVVDRLGGRPLRSGTSGISSALGWADEQQC
jgi:hypothetical protein